MPSATSRRQGTGIRRRTFGFAAVVAVLLYLTYFFLVTNRLEARKDELVIDVLQADEELSGELYRVFHGLEDDFAFFEKEIQFALTHKGEGANGLLNFLSSHPQYFKVRLVSVNGSELFKVIPGPSGKFERSTDLHDLSRQNFFLELQKTSFGTFSFSSMDANVVNAKTVIPIQPTIRVSKRAHLNSGDEALLIVNIDGESLLDLFRPRISGPIRPSEKMLIDQFDHYMASIPRLPVEAYTVSRQKIPESIRQRLRSSREVHGNFDLEDEVIVYTRFPLPQSKEQWFLISRVPQKRIFAAIRNERLTWVFWEIVVFLLCVTWYWKVEKKKYQEQVVQVLLRERGEFIQNVSHQLKTPLTIVLNTLSGSGSEEARSEVVHLIKVIDDLLLISHMDSFKNVTFSRENVVEILQDALSLVGAKAREKGVVIKLDLDENVELHSLERFVLPELLKSAFFNLLDNAMDFSPEKGEIRLGVTLRELQIVISVSDEGPGVPEDFLPHIFERFTRARGQTRKGSGLGLAIARKIIDLHQGSLSYVRKEKGATFEVLL